MSPVDRRWPGYFDWNASAPLRPEVAEAMAETYREAPGNPSSLHTFGVDARLRLERARRQIARFLGVAAETIVFTGGGSDSVNLAIRGAAFANRRADRGTRIVTSAAEHRAVLDTCQALGYFHRFPLTVLPVDGAARVDVEVLRASLKIDTGLVSLMLANNEIGSLNFGEVHSRVIRTLCPQAIIHVDAIQALGKIPLRLDTLGCDLVSLAAHKIGGPRGIGLLYRKPGVVLEPQVTGGAQEGNIRAGTEDVAGAVGFARALELAITEMTIVGERIAGLREMLWQRLTTAMPGVIRNTPETETLHNTLNVSFPPIPSRYMVQELDRRGYAVSSGSACSSEGGAPSHVLMAMTSDESRSGSAIRFSLGNGAEREDIEGLAAACTAAAATLSGGIEILK